MVSGFVILPARLQNPARTLCHIGRETQATETTRAQPSTRCQPAPQTLSYSTLGPTSVPLGLFVNKHPRSPKCVNHFSQQPVARFELAIQDRLWTPNLWLHGLAPPLSIQVKRYLSSRNLGRRRCAEPGSSRSRTRWEPASGCDILLLPVVSVKSCFRPALFRVAVAGAIKRLAQLPLPNQLGADHLYSSIFYLATPAASLAPVARDAFGDGCVFHTKSVTSSLLYTFSFLRASLPRRINSDNYKVGLKPPVLQGVTI